MGERELPYTHDPSRVFENQITKGLIGEVFGDNARRIYNLFSCMEIAEEVIANAQQIYPERKEEIFESFRFLKPSPLLQFSGFHNPELFGHHAQEIVERIVRDEDIEPATTAELVSVFCEASLLNPLSHDYVVAYAKVFAAVFPTQAEEIWPQLPQESYPGRADEIIGRMRRKLRQER